MPRKKRTPAGGTAGAGAAVQVAAGQPIATQYSAVIGRSQPLRVVGLPLDLSRQIDCAVFVEETVTDPLTRRFAQILRRRLEDSIPTDGGAA